MAASNSALVFDPEMSEVEMIDMNFDDDDYDLVPSYNFVFVDIQGFLARNNQFICKEFCFIDGDFKFHALVKSPYSFNKLPVKNQETAQWLTKNFHGLDYNSGKMHMIELIQEMFPKFNNKIAVVRGSQKIKWLKHMFRTCGEVECINIQEQGFDMDLYYNQSEKPCMFHRESKKRDSFHCAVKSAEKLKEITNNNLNA